VREGGHAEQFDWKLVSRACCFLYQYFSYSPAIMMLFLSDLKQYERELSYEI